MSTAPAATDAKPAKAKSGGGGKALLTIVAATLGAAAGGFGAVIAAGSLGLGVGGGAANHAKAAPAAGAVEYVELEQAFTSNLADTGRYLPVKLSVSQSGGGAITAAMAQHKPAIVSAVLGVLGEAGEADVATREAKDRLRVRLQKVINETLKHNGVAGGIDEVFFTSLVVQ